MTSKLKNLIIAVIVLAALSGTMLFLQFSGKDNNDSEEAKPPSYVTLTDIKQENLRYAEIVRNTGKLVFSSMDGENWQIKDTPDFFRINKDSVKSALRIISSMRSGEIITENASGDDLKMFGLNKPQVLLTLKDKDGKTIQVEVGIKSPSGSGYYARIKDNPEIVLLPAYSASYLFKNLNDFRDKSLPVITPEKLVYIELRHNGTDFIAERSEINDGYRSLNNKFVIKSPWKGTYFFDDYEFAQLVQEHPFPAQVIDYYDNLDPSDPKLGLDKEKADRLFLKDSDGNVVDILIGNKDKKGNYFAISGSGDSTVFTLSENNTAIVRTPPFKLTDKFVFLASIQNIKQVKIQRGTDSWIMKRDPAGKEDDVKDDHYFINDLEIPFKEFSSAYQKLIGITWEGVAEDRVSLGTPDCRITYYNLDPAVKPVTIRLWNYNDVYYQGSADKQPVEFLTGKYQIENLIGDLDALKEYGS